MKIIIILHDLWSKCYERYCILAIHLRMNVNTFAWILKHIALQTQHWENRTTLKTERSALSDWFRFGQVWLHCKHRNDIHLLLSIYRCLSHKLSWLSTRHPIGRSYSPAENGQSPNYSRQCVMSGFNNSSPIKRYVIKKSVKSGEKRLLGLNPGTLVTLAVFRDIAYHCWKQSRISQ